MKIAVCLPLIGLVTVIFADFYQKVSFIRYSSETSKSQIISSSELGERYGTAMFERGKVWRAPPTVEGDERQVARGGLRRPSGLAASKVVPDMCLVSRLRCGLCCVACGEAVREGAV